MPAKFSLGRTVITPGALGALDPTSVQESLRRHQEGDWGELDEHDRTENERSLRNGSRLFSVYRDPAGVKFWIITEWDRSVTTVLLPKEY